MIILIPKENKMYKYNSIVVDSDGELIVWTNGSLSASPKLKKRVKEASQFDREVELIHGVQPVVANLNDDEDFLAITAAMFSASPGRSRLLEAPQVVTDWFESFNSDEEGIVY